MNKWEFYNIYSSSFLTFQSWTIFDRKRLAFYFDLGNRSMVENDFKPNIIEKNEIIHLKKISLKLLNYKSLEE